MKENEEVIRQLKRLNDNVCVGVIGIVLVVAILAVEALIALT